MILVGPDDTYEAGQNWVFGPILGNNILTNTHRHKSILYIYIYNYIHICLYVNITILAQSCLTFFSLHDLGCISKMCSSDMPREQYVGKRNGIQRASVLLQISQL